MNWDSGYFFRYLQGMADIKEIKKQFLKITNLERDIKLKQLQVTRLLKITQAINNNISAEQLYDMYRVFLQEELSIRKMALFVHCEQDSWHIAASIGVDVSKLGADVCSIFPKYTAAREIDTDSHPMISQFDIIIPVFHKSNPLAYVLVGGFEAKEDAYDKVQFITTLTNIISVAIENKRLFKRQLDQERLKRGMSLATEIQQMLVPDVLPQTEIYQLASIYRPHDSVGGDYFDFQESEDGKLTFCIGDISGKGVAAALLMANFSAHFRALIGQSLSLKEIVLNLNKAVFRITRGDRFITFFIAEYDTHTRQLQYFNCGHIPPILVDDGYLFHLKEGSTLLGIDDELPKIEMGSITLKGDAMLLTFTDGLTDIRDSEGAFISEENLDSFVMSHYLLSAKGFNEELQTAVEKFMGTQVYPDDFTVLTARFF